MSQLADDIKLLVKALEKLDTGEEDPPSRLVESKEAFESMLDGLLEHRWPCLTDKQRTWVADVAGEVVYENAWSAGKVPDGLGLSRIKTPEVLRNLPKKPPQRKLT